MTVIDLKTKSAGHLTAYETLKGLVKMYGWKSVQLALDEIRRELNKEEEAKENAKL